MNGKIWNLVWFNAGWFACVLGAAAGRPMLGPILMIGFLVAHVYRARRPLPEALVVLAGGAVGTVFDSALHALDALRFDAMPTVPGLAPLWMTTLWMGFASMFASSLDWLRGRYAIGAALGLLGGPMAYAGGERFGALDVNGSTGIALVALEYAVAIPLLLWIDRRIRAAFAGEPSEASRRAGTRAGHLRRAAGIAMITVAIVGLMTCSSYPPMPTVARLDLPRFMGDWFVVGHIPASSEADAYNAVESYALRDDGRIQTTYAFRDGGFGRALDVMRPVGAVEDSETNATWGMQFLWPFWAEYLVVWIADDYSATIVGRTKRDYAWLMTRSPNVSPATWQTMLDKLATLGYDTSKVRRVPHQWPDPGHPANEAATRTAGG